jgi:hypothetical protein
MVLARGARDPINRDEPPYPVSVIAQGEGLAVPRLPPPPPRVHDALHEPEKEKK